MDRFDELRRVMANALGDLNILAGDEVAGTDVGSWRDVPPETSERVLLPLTFPFFGLTLVLV